MLRRLPRMLTLALALALALALGWALPAGATAAAAAGAPRGFVGMVLAGPLYPSGGPTVNLARQLDTMVASGVESLRVVINWSAAQPYPSWSQVPPGQAGQFTDVGGIPTSFLETDQLLALAAQRRLTVMPVVLYAPSWDQAPHPAGTYAAPASTGPYAAFLAALVHRYGPHGSFWRTHAPAVPIREWQIWNEPNIAIFWPEQPFQRSYTALLRAAHDAIKAADPGAKIVLAGMPNYSWTALRSLYRIRGVRRLFDVVAVHPYTRRPQGVIAILRRVRRVMNRAGDRRKPIVADEISWPSSKGKTPHSEGFDFATTERGQASDISKLMPLLARYRRRLSLAGFDYFTWAGIEDRGGISFDFSGLFRYRSGQFIAKPAFYSFRRAALRLESCRAKARVATVCRRRS